jgi:membrane protein YqaA with SNARE-associated domain
MLAYLQSVAPAWIFASCFGLSVASAVCPWLNGEIVLLSLTPLAGSWLGLAGLAVAASAGQMIGKSILYFTARRLSSVAAASERRGLARWRARLEGRRRTSLALVFVSSAVGIPPFYLITVLAGALKLPLPGFIGAGSAGRLVRFTAVAFLPHVFLGLV